MKTEREPLVIIVLIKTSLNFLSTCTVGVILKEEHCFKYWSDTGVNKIRHFGKMLPNDFSRFVYGRNATDYVGTSRLTVPGTLTLRLPAHEGSEFH